LDSLRNGDRSARSDVRAGSIHGWKGGAEI
jgi:hypothetical protein